MKFILDMVHHNPGEKPFETSFLSPDKLRAYGYNGQVFKHINCAATFEEVCPHLFSVGSEERLWINRLHEKISGQIIAAKKAGLSVYYHIDLIIFPKLLVEYFGDEIVDPQSGRISFARMKTRQLHQVMFDEIFERYEIDGVIVRIGETYLLDTPYHVGNSAVMFDKTIPTKAEKEAWADVIHFLREVVCQRHNKYVIFRTWDLFADRFHANRQYYLDITNPVEPHSKLLFSIKHTALDFWRRVKFNECIGAGNHGQIIEVQCQREYEGKGAYPNYIADGVIHGFSENHIKKGIAEMVGNPLIHGIFTWSRGGGWYGPYLKDEIWCDLNAFVLARWAANPELSEEEYFNEFCRTVLFLNDADCVRFREVAMLSAEAVLKGRYCEVYDKTLKESVVPVNLWMRDDRLGGLEQLKPVFEYLFANQLFGTALAEKEEAVKIWQRILAIFEKIEFKNELVRSHLRTSILYGGRLFEVIYRGWQVMALGYIGHQQGIYDIIALKDAIIAYDLAWQQYCSTELLSGCASLYKGVYWNWPGAQEQAGMSASVDFCRAAILIKG